MAAIINREIRLKNRPAGLPSEDDFELVEAALPALQEGEVLVRNHYMSVDPYMRGRMYDRPSYVPPFQLGQPLEGGCVGQVVQRRGHTTFQEGDYVLSRLGWREYYVTDGSHLTRAWHMRPKRLLGCSQATTSARCSSS
jgi:NADPH-dependent curcumin reductase CurA